MNSSAGKNIFSAQINGDMVEILIPAHTTLLEVLRDHLDLIGTKEGCGEGVCGACTVLVDSVPRRSCLTLAMEVQDCSVQTIEGLSPKDGLSPEQEAFIENGAIQCGFCTPGMLLASKHLLDENPDPCLDEIKTGLSGHICRCTGYAKIFDAVSAAGAKRRGEDA